MTARERFRAVLRLERPEGRLPMIEWAPWWDKTIDRWKREGLPADLSFEESVRYFGLDVIHCIGAGVIGPGCPAAASHGAGLIADAAGYAGIRPHLLPEASIASLVETARSMKAAHDAGEIVIRLWLDGFFWYPRNLFGIQRHLYAFYDSADLMHRMNDELADFHLRTIEQLCQVLVPDMAGFAEDMSYNLGPMLSEEHFQKFLQPYYERVVPALKRHGIPVLVDSDGDITGMIPWLQAAGVEGVYPLERQAGVDLPAIRARHPRWLMLGGYDKMVMTRGEAAMRGEFERLLPVLRSAGYIPSVDHQTPPGVSLEEYRTYIRLFKEYAQKGAEQWACG